MKISNIKLMQKNIKYQISSKNIKSINFPHGDLIQIFYLVHFFVEKQAVKMLS